LFGIQRPAHLAVLPLKSLDAGIQSAIHMAGRQKDEFMNPLSWFKPGEPKRTEIRGIRWMTHRFRSVSRAAVGNGFTTVDTEQALENRSMTKPR
jgi:hypothetical protein